MLADDNNIIFSQEYRIYLEDTDAGGIVYHANHLKLYERCRRDWLRALGMASYFYQKHSVEPTPTSEMISPDIQFVVSKANISYHRPVLLDSLVTVVVADVVTKASSLILDQRIYDMSQPKKQQLLSQADITLVCVATTKNDEGQTHVRPTRLPADFIALFSRSNTVTD